MKAPEAVIGTAHPGPSTVIGHQLETVHSANEGTDTSFGSPGCGSGSVESVLPFPVVPAATHDMRL